MAKEIWIYAIAFLDLLASSLVIPSMAPYLRMIGGSTFIIGVVISTNIVLQLISAPIAVSWSNNKGQGTMLQISLLIGCISFFVMGSANTVLLIFVCRAVEGLFHHTQAMCTVLLESIGPHEGHAKFQRWWNSFRTYSIILGGALVGNIMEFKGGYHYVCIIIAMIHLLNYSIAYSFIPKVISKEKKKQEKKNKSESTMKSEKPSTVSEINKTHYSLSKILKPLTDLVYIPQSKSILDVLIITFLIEFALMAHIQNFAPVLWDVYKTPSRWIGYTLGLQGLMTASALSWIHYISKLYSSDQRIFHSFGVFMLSSAFLYFAPSWNGVVICIIPMSISYAVLKTSTSELLKQRTASDKSVSLATSGSKMSTIARIVAPIYAGLAYDSYGYFGTSMLKVAAAGTGAVISLSLLKPNNLDKKQK